MPVPTFWFATFDKSIVDSLEKGRHWAHKIIIHFGLRLALVVKPTHISLMLTCRNEQRNFAPRVADAAITKTTQSFVELFEKQWRKYWKTVGPFVPFSDVADENFSTRKLLPPINFSSKTLQFTRVCVFSLLNFSRSPSRSLSISLSLSLSLLFFSLACLRSLWPSERNKSEIVMCFTYNQHSANSKFSYLLFGYYAVVGVAARTLALSHVRRIIPFLTFLPWTRTY